MAQTDFKLEFDLDGIALLADWFSVFNNCGVNACTFGNHPKTKEHFLKTVAGGPRTRELVWNFFAASNTDPTVCGGASESSSYAREFMAGREHGDRLMSWNTGMEIFATC